MRRALAVCFVVACGPSHPAPEHGKGSGTSVVEPPPADPAPRPPVAERRVVTNTYHGVSVDDAYQWLEGEDDDVRTWSDGENGYARAILDGLDTVDALRDEYRAILAAPQVRYRALHSAGGKLFALRKDPAKDQPELIVADGPDALDAATIVVDPNTLTAGTTIDWFEPSPDGARVAVSMSVGGSELGDLHLLGLDGKPIDEVIPNVYRPTALGDAAWSADGKTIYYTRYPRAGEAHADQPDYWSTLWSHTIGAPADQDVVELAEGLPDIAEIRVEARGAYVLATIQNGDGGTFRHYLRGPKAKPGKWMQMSDWADAIVKMQLGPGDTLWMVSQHDAPGGKVLSLQLGKKNAKPKLVVPEAKEAIVTDFGSDALVITKDRVYAVYQLGGPTELRAFTHAGKAAKAPVLPPVSSVGLPVAWGDDLLVWSASFTTPPSWTRYTPKTGEAAVVAALSPPPPVTIDGFGVKRVTATSQDGTEVPVNIVWPDDSPHDGTTPCLVEAYGGYGLSQTPWFLAYYQPLLRQGICYVQVNVRGGAEFGEAWHANGMLTHKQNVFDDFAAALQMLVDVGYSSPAHLAIIGGSNGGLLMGAMITQHPDLVHAVVSEVGIYDMLRVELSPNGAFNATEFGTVKDPDQFAAMYAYSPYHHVTERAYPAILMTTGANDGRVAPWHSRKMIAALQAAQTGDAPILLRTSETSGHGIGTGMTEVIDQSAHVAAFLRWQLQR